jgi:hypothetical protein
MPMVTKELQREYCREWTAKRRADFFKNKKCAHCQSTEKLELHHVDPSQKISHAIWSWSEVRRKQEIEKCIVLCRKCHTEHHNETKRTKEHGSTMYRNGCRCDTCKKAQAERQAKLRASKK